MALLEEDDGLPTPGGNGPRISIWSRSDGMSTIELDLTHAEAQAVLPALQGYLRDLCEAPDGLP